MQANEIETLGHANAYPYFHGSFEDVKTPHPTASSLTLYSGRCRVPGCDFETTPRLAGLNADMNARRAEERAHYEANRPMDYDVREARR